MPSPPAEPFATPGWFEKMPVPIPDVVPDQPDFVVEHQAITPQGGTVAHHQVFSGCELAAWAPGPASSEPDLVLVRSIACDAGDLLGRLTAAEVINNTSVVIGCHSPTCPLGIAGVIRPGLEQAVCRTIDLCLEVAATPFGDAELAIRLNYDGTQHLIEPSDADADITLRLQWPALVEWLHTDTILGHLVNRGDLEIDGPFLKITYIDGHLSWPPTPNHQQRSQEFKQAMTAYQQLRQNPAYTELMDRIEEACDPTGGW